MRDAFLRAGIEIERRALDVPRRVGLARARRVGAVVDARLFVVEHVDALGAARSARQVEAVLRVRHIAFVRFHLQVRFRADKRIAVADDPDIAVRIGHVGVLVVVQRVRLDDRHVPAHFRRTLGGHVLIGGAGGPVAEQERGRLLPRTQRPLFELRREAQVAGAVERLRLGRRARELRVRERRHETRSSKQRRDEPPSAWQSMTLGNRFRKLSWRHVWVAVRCRYASASTQCLELAPEFARKPRSRIRRTRCKNAASESGCERRMTLDRK
jgi:hypothetical protein